MLSLIVSRILSLILMIALGFVLSKLNILKSEYNSGLSALLVKVFLPCLIINSFQLEFSTEKLHGLLLTLLLAFVSWLIAVILGYVVFNKRTVHDVGVARFAAIYANTGFIGLPIISAAFGKEGVFYFAAYVLVTNFLGFMHIEILMAPEGKRVGLKTVLTPPVIAVVVGVLLFVLKITLPDFLGTAVSSLGNMTTPVAMLITGFALSQLKLKVPDHLREIVWVSIFKLIVNPILVLVICIFLPLSLDDKLMAIIAAACPSLALTTAYAVKYQHDDLYSGLIVSVTTILSMVTMPLLFLFASNVL